MVLRKHHPQQNNFEWELFRDIYALLKYQVHLTFARGKEKKLVPVLSFFRVVTWGRGYEKIVTNGIMEGGGVQNDICSAASFFNSLWYDFFLIDCSKNLKIFLFGSPGIISMREVLLIVLRVLLLIKLFLKIFSFRILNYANEQLLNFV